MSRHSASRDFGTSRTHFGLMAECSLLINEPQAVVLEHLRRWVLRRIDAVRRMALLAPDQAGTDRMRLLTFVTVDVHNSARLFLRSYYL